MNALTAAALQFQTPDRTVGLARAGATYTLSRNLGQAKRWEIDLAVAAGQPGGTTTHGLAGSRIVDGGTVTLLDQPSAYEYALQVYPYGASDSAFRGTGIHGFDDETALTFAIDGLPVALADGGNQSGLSVVGSRRSLLSHPDVGVIGDVACTYAMTYLGLDVEWFITWRRALDSATCYGAMMPVNEALNRGRVDGRAAVTLTTNDDSIATHNQSASAVLWQQAGKHAACLFLVDYDAVGNWAYSLGKDLWIQDRAGGLINKAYAEQRNRPIAAGDVWHSHFRLMADYIDGNAETMLA